MRSISKTGEYTVAEFKFVTRSGEVRNLTVTFCYVSGEDSWDGIPSIYSVGIDITEERREQERQRRALEDAYQSRMWPTWLKAIFCRRCRMISGRR